MRPHTALPAGRLLRLVAACAIAALALAGCSLVSGPAPEPTTPDGVDDAPSSTSSPEPSASEEARLVVDDGFVTLSTLPEPIATVEYELPGSGDLLGTVVRQRADLVQLRRSGDVVRAVVAGLAEPGADAEVADGEAPEADMATMKKARSDYEVGWQLYDPEAATAADPLRTEDECLCTGSVIAAHADRVSLFWADFPAPTHERFTLLLGSQHPPMEDLRVPDEPPGLPEPGDTLDYPWNEPPARPGRGAGEPVVHDVVARSETLSGLIATTSGEDQQLALPADVLFALDSDVVEAGAGADLDAAAAAVAGAARGGQVVVTGHTDDQGSQEYNQDLSLRRARAVAERVGAVMAAAGTTLDVRGAGEDEPLVPNATDKGAEIPENQARNRRVAFSWQGAAPVTPVEGTSTVRPALQAAVPAPGPSPAGSVADALSTTFYDIRGRTTARDGGDPMRLDVGSVRREGDRLRVDLTVAPLVDGGSWSPARARLPADNPGFGGASLIGSALVDPATGVASYALVDDAGQCLCTRDVQGTGLALGDVHHFWAYYPAPPAGTAAVDLQMGTFGRLEGVPIS